MDIDVLERARAGDIDAFRALTGQWDALGMRVALLVAADRPGALAAVRDAFSACWTAFPSMHSEEPFRPRLLALITRAALERERIAGATQARAHEGEPARVCLDTMPERQRIACILSVALHATTAEIALVLGVNVGVAMREARSARRALASCGSADAVSTLRSFEPGDPVATSRQGGLPSRFFDEFILPRLEQPVIAEAHRVIGGDAAAAWAGLTQTSVLAAFSEDSAVRRGTGARGQSRTESLAPGVRIRIRGALPGGRAVREEIIVTRAEPDAGLLAWTARARLRGMTGTIERRYAFQLVADGECMLQARLHGVAFPPGASGRMLRRAWNKSAGAAAADLHRATERAGARLSSGQ